MKPFKRLLEDIEISHWAARKPNKSFLTHLSEAQKFSSSSTSINSTKLPKGYSSVGKHHGWAKGSTHLDIGGGKFDNAVKHLAGHGVSGHVYDPFNRSEKHNTRVLSKAGNGKSDTASMFNVLNVIKETENHISALQLAHQSLKRGGTLHVGVYAGDRSGKGRQTGKDSYQRNEKIHAYLPTVQKIFPNARVHKGMIHATKEEQDNK